MTQIALVETDGAGGLIHFAYQMATALTEAGDSFTVDATVPLWNATAIEPSWVARLPRPVAALRHRLRRVWRAVRFTWAWERLTRRLLRDRPDVVQFSIIRFAFQERYLRRLRDAGITLTQVCHEFEPRESGRLARLLSRRLGGHVYDHFSAIFFLGDAVRQEFLETFPVPAHLTHVIPHGDESLFLRMADRGGDFRADYAIAAGVPVVGFFGGLRPSKGLNDLIDAFAVVHEELPECHLVIAGLPTPDIDPNDLEERAVRLGLGTAVTIDARYLAIEEVGPLVRTADVIALPYRTGTASGALQVAYAFERPVVASDTGSVAEAVVDGVTGLVVPPANPDALARALVKILSDRAEAHAMGIAGRRHAAEHHAWEPIARTVLAVSETARGAGG
jgi:glycosyltransferase involved in cell wall biosynthesis